ncbi:MFS transporter [Actinomadura keratinilytica]
MPTRTPEAPPEPAPAPPSSTRRGNPWLTLIAVAFGLFMVALDGSVVSMANPEIGRDLNAGTADLQWVTNSYLLALAAALILGGKLGDRFGRRTYYLIGVAASPSPRSPSAWPGRSRASSPSAPSRASSARC